jgi:hypothetical protein
VTRLEASAGLLFLGTILALADLRLASVPQTGFSPPGSAGGDSYLPIVSADGRWVLFASTANNLTPQSSNSIALSAHAPPINIYRHDRSNGVTALVSANLLGAPANDHCTPLALSANGQYALFETSATDLVPDDTNGVSDVFVRDLGSGTTLLVSTDTNGVPAKWVSHDSVMTPDGRYVAFSSASANIVPDDTNQIEDVFVRDLQSSNTTLVSVGAKSALFKSAQGGGIAPISTSDAPEITPDGRYVIFHSSATNVVPGVTNIRELYIRDLVNQTTEVVSTNARSYSPPPGFPIVPYNRAISSNGQFVAFEMSISFSSIAVFRYDVLTHTTQMVGSNAFPGGLDYRYLQTLDMTPDGRLIAFIGKTNTGTTTTCVSVWNADSGTTHLVSTNLDGTIQTDSTCDLLILDDNGQFVFFLCTATNLTTNVVSSEPHFYRHDLLAGVTHLVDKTTNGSGSTGTILGVPSVSADGRYVAYDSECAFIVTNDNNSSWDVFLSDMATETTELVSVHDLAFPSKTAAPGNSSRRLSMSLDGRYVAFASAAEGLSPGASNHMSAVFRRDLLNGTTALASRDTNGFANGNGPSLEPIVSGNGRYVAFTSSANNLVANDTNRALDVFVRDFATGMTTLISSNRFNGGPGDKESRLLSIDFDGRFVLFQSAARNLTAGTFGFGSRLINLFLHDRDLGTTYALTFDDFGSASMTSDGRYVAFFGDLLAGLSSSQLYIWDSNLGMRVQTNALSGVSGVSISSSGQRVAYSQGGELKVWDRIPNTVQSIGSDVPASPYGPNLRFSADERFLVLSTKAAFVAGESVFGTNHVYLRDLQAGTNCLISRSAVTGLPANGASFSPDISADGRFIIYSSDAANIVVSDTNRAQDVFLYDCQLGTTVLLSASAYGSRSGNGASGAPAFSGDRQTGMFQSFASDLTENDFNQGMDAFFLRLQTTNPVIVGQIVYAPGTSQPPKLAWIAPPGNSYHVEFKNVLADATWQPLAGSVVIVDDIGYATDPSPNPVGRFYRIVAE